MNSEYLRSERFEKLNKLHLFLSDIEMKLNYFSEAVNWDYKNLEKEIFPEMITCSYNKHHRVPKANIDIHEAKCQLKESYNNLEIQYPEHFSQGSFVVFDSELLYKVTENLPTLFTGEKSKRAVPNSKVSFDCNFSREEKLAIYEYVIANTKKQKLFSDLCKLPCEKKEEKKTLSAWEMAAAERDAKRRRASYRNKIHTKNKNITEIMREVIDSQMESLKEIFLKNAHLNDCTDEKKLLDKNNKSDSRSSEESKKKKDKIHSTQDFQSRRKNNDNEICKEKRKRHSHYERNDEHGESSYKWRSLSRHRKSHYSSGSRSDDKPKKRKFYLERSHSRESGKL